MTIGSIEFTDQEPPLGELVYIVTARDAAGNRGEEASCVVRHGRGTVRSEIYKLEGAGNDFVLGVGAWAGRLDSEPDLVRRLL